MEPIFVVETNDVLDLDYALVKHTTCQLSYKFPEQFRDKKTSGIVDVTLVVSHDKAVTDNPGSQENRLKLNYYIIISRPEIYPTAYDNRGQSGIFKTVTKPRNAEVMEAVKVILPKKESVSYVGYYSTHEQSMEAVMHLQASQTEDELSSVFRKASVHCRCVIFLQNFLLKN